jgi:hypothetical protein
MIGLRASLPAVSARCRERLLAYLTRITHLRHANYAPPPHLNAFKESQIDQASSRASSTNTVSWFAYNVLYNRLPCCSYYNTTAPYHDTTQPAVRETSCQVNGTTCLFAELANPRSSQHPFRLNDAIKRSVTRCGKSKFRFH